jgi:hypothetical protein
LNELCRSGEPSEMRRSDMCKICLVHEEVVLNQHHQRTTISLNPGPRERDSGHLTTWPVWAATSCCTSEALFIVWYHWLVYSQTNRESDRASTSRTPVMTFSIYGNASNLAMNVGLAFHRAAKSSPADPSTREDGPPREHLARDTPDTPYVDFTECRVPSKSSGGDTIA